MKILKRFDSPPHIKVYAQRYPVGWVPDCLLGAASQLISWARAQMNIRTT